MLFPAKISMTPAAEQLHSRAELLEPGHIAPFDLTVLISCYNERLYIIDTIETVHSALQEGGGINYEIIIIDDCSSDNSTDLVDEYIRAHPERRIVFCRNKVNRGLAQNYLDAAFMGKGKYYRLICGDDSEPRDTMIAIFRELGTADILIPYYVTIKGKSLYRRILSKIYSNLINLISVYQLHYYNGLAVHLRYNVMRWHSNTRGFGFQADIICLLLEQGFTFKEVPVFAAEQRGKKSTALTFKNILSISHTLFDIGIRRLANWAYRSR